MNKHQSSELDVSRFGLRVAAGLSEYSDASLPTDIAERLRFAREQAVTRSRALRATRPQPETAAEVVRQGTSLALGGPGRGRWLKLASLLPLVLLVGGLLLIQHSQWYQQMTAAAEMDAAILSDKLPPAAYGDPGFSEYLSDEEQQQQGQQQQQQQQPAEQQAQDQ